MPEGDLQRRLGRNLLAFRKAHGLSQEALAEALGVHRTYMGGVERIADRLGVDPLELLK